MVDVVESLKPRDDGLLYADDLTSDQFMAVMDTFTDTQHFCPVCNARSWEIQLEEDGKPVIGVVPTYRDSSNQLLVLFLNCAKCGFLRTHLAEHICRMAGKL